MMSSLEQASPRERRLALFHACMGRGLLGGVERVIMRQGNKRAHTETHTHTYIYIYTHRSDEAEAVGQHLHAALNTHIACLCICICICTSIGEGVEGHSEAVTVYHDVAFVREGTGHARVPARVPRLMDECVFGPHDEVPNQQTLPLVGGEATHGDGLAVASLVPVQ
jgi:hypothetical protein